MSAGPLPDPRRQIPLDAYNRALAVRIGALPPGPRAAFATACAERLAAAWLSFMAATGVDDGGLVRRALDRAWTAAALGGAEGVTGDDAALIEACVALIPDAETPGMLPAHADNAIAATAYALQAALDGDAEAAAWAASTCMDTLDAYLLPGLPVVSDEEEAEVWAHPLVRAEVERRDADLALLATTNLATAIAVVRARAAGASLLPLDELVHVHLGPPSVP